MGDMRDLPPEPPGFWDTKPPSKSAEAHLQIEADAALGLFVAFPFLVVFALILIAVLA